MPARCSDFERCSVLIGILNRQELKDFIWRNISTLPMLKTASASLHSAHCIVHMCCMWGLNYSVLVRYLRCLKVPPYVIWVVESASVCNIRLWCSRAQAWACQETKNWWSLFIAMRMSVSVHVRYHSCQESHPFFTPLMDHKKMPVRTNNVLATYFRYLRVPNI